MTFRAIFFGTPAIAVPSLEALATIAEVALVITQPDKPVGRHSEPVPPAVKVRARALGLPVEQPTKVRTPDFAERLRALDVDVAVVIAYGRILPRAVLDAPRKGCLNLHASLLPRWRGAAPIQWSIVHGDHETGITLMQMDEGMDTGPMLAKRHVVIGPDETSGDLAERLGRLAAEVVRDAVPAALRGELVATPQHDADSTSAPVLEKADGKIDFVKTARAVHDHVRGMSPWPGAFTHAPSGTQLKVHKTSVVTESGTKPGEPLQPSVAPIPGTVLLADPKRGVHVAAGVGGVVALLDVQGAGKKRVDGASFAAGRGVKEGDVLR